MRIKEINIEEGESNLMQMGARMYSARISRFLSVDPLHELMPSHNPYHYAFNSPLVWKDPSGLAPVKDKNIHSEKLQGQLIKLRNLSNPIMPGDEYCIYIKDDRDFYFSAEYGGDFADAPVWDMPLLGGGGSGGSRPQRSTQAYGPRTQGDKSLGQANGGNVKAGFVVNKYGTIKRYNDDANDKNIYYRRDDGAIETLGEIGGTLNTNEIIANILDFNIFVAELESVVNLYRFFNKVKSKGDWDFKNRKKGESNIFGLLHGTGTIFSVSGYGYMDSEQFGNFHFGVISSAWGYSEHFAKWGAGIYQIISDTSPFMCSKSFALLMSNSITLPLVLGWTLIPPHGDDYIDHHMIGVGYWYFKVSRGSK